MKPNLGVTKWAEYRHIRRAFDVAVRLGMSARKLLLFSTAVYRTVATRLKEVDARYSGHDMDKAVYACETAAAASVAGLDQRFYNKLVFLERRLDGDLWPLVDYGYLQRYVASHMILSVFHHPSSRFDTSAFWVVMRGCVRVSARLVRFGGAPRSYSHRFHNRFYRAGHMFLPILRDVFNPFLVHGLMPALPKHVYRLAGVLDDGDQDVAPVLADALEEAGACHPGLSEHLRSGQHHFRGCWAVDAIRGRT